MAIVLGNFNANKSVKMMRESVSYKIKLETISKLIVALEEQVEMAQDIYDTYYYIKDNDENFSKELWSLLCKNKVAKIDINSYFAWKIGYGGYIMLSRHGVSVYHQEIKEQLMTEYRLTEKELFRGYALLEVYLKSNYVSNDILDRMIEDLQVFLLYFKQYANDFFNSVSAYQVKKID